MICSETLVAMICAISAMPSTWMPATASGISRSAGPHHTQRALGTVGAGARLIGASAILKASFRRRARGDRPARELPEEVRYRSRPDGLEPLARDIPRRPQAGHAVPAATLKDDAVAPDDYHEIRQPFDQRIPRFGQARHPSILWTRTSAVLDARHGCRVRRVPTPLICSDFSASRE